MKVRFKKYVANTLGVRFSGGQVIDVDPGGSALAGIAESAYEVLDAPAKNNDEADNADGGDEKTEDETTDEAGEAETIGTAVTEPEKDRAVNPSTSRGKGS